jgi:hypothetical protein
MKDVMTSVIAINWQKDLTPWHYEPTRENMAHDAEVRNVMQNCRVHSLPLTVKK